MGGSGRPGVGAISPWGFWCCEPIGAQRIAPALDSIWELLLVQTSEVSRVRRPRSVSSVHFLNLVEETGETGFWTLDLVTGEETHSSGSSRLLGVPSEQNHALLDVVHREDRPELEEMLAGLRRGQATGSDLRVLKPDGTMRWVNIKAEPLFGAGDQPLHAIGIMRDISLTRSLRQALIASRHRYTSLLELLSGVEWGVDAVGNLLFSKEWTTLTGQPLEDTSGLGWLRMLQDKDRDLMRENLREAMDRPNFKQSVAIKCADGISRKYWISAKKTTDASGGAQLLGLLAPVPVDAESDRAVCVDSRFGRHVKAARALLRWTHADLAHAACVSVSSIRRLEIDATSLRATTVDTVMKCLSEKGIRFDTERGAVTLIRA